MLRRWSIVGVTAGLLVGLVQVVAAPSAFASTGTTTTAVNIRSGPGASNALLGTVAANSTVSFHCFVAGERETGKYGTEDIWDALDSGGYVADAFVFTGSNSAVVPACPSAQFGTGHYPVAWTGGGGAQPYSGTSTSTSPDGGVLPDGLVVTVTCETTGQTLTDDKGFVSDLWDQLNTGAYIPNVYIDTQVNGPTPGLPTCSQSSSGGSSSGGGGNSGSGNGASGGSGGQGSGPSAPTGSAPPRQTTKPTGNIASVKFAPATCPSPQEDNGKCLLPKQPTPGATTRLKYAKDFVEMTDLIAFCGDVDFYNCENLGEHYLAGAGTPMTVSVADLYSGAPGFQGIFQYWLRQYVPGMIQTLQSTPSGGSAAKDWGTGWRAFDAASKTNDWHYALGNFSVQLAGDVWIGPADRSGDRPVQIRYQSFMGDIYNFDPGQKFGSFEDLAKVGIAADFRVTGQSKIEVITTSLKDFNVNMLVARAS